MKGGSKSTSLGRVPYDLRMAKQVERRMMADAFQLLRHGFPISEYCYFGFGSNYFVDFILFHKFLGLRDMVSVEHSEANESRVTFNQPFDFVDIKIGSVSKFLPDLDPDKQYIVWLDYDCRVSSSVLADIITCCGRLGGGSIFVVTVDVALKDSEAAVELHDAMRRELSPYFEPSWKPREFTPTKFSRTNVSILEKAITAGLSARRAVSYHNLFNFRYADGHEMITVGGMIGGPREQQSLASCPLHHAPYLRRSLSEAEYVIQVPLLTRKERLFLEKQMPEAKRSGIRATGVPRDEVLAYCEVYRFLPSYAELLL